MTPWLLILGQVAVLAYALLGGVFLAFSDFIMRALRRSPGGAQAMQSINREVFRIVFMALFLGMVPISLILAVGGLLTAPNPLPFVLAGAVYVIGVFGVTAAGNVPLNNALAATDPSTPQGAQWWSETYVTRWTRLNTVRALGCIAAAFAVMQGLLGIS